MVKVVIAELSKEALILPQDHRLVYDYLINVEKWTRFELELFSNCLAVLTVKEAYHLGLDMLDDAELLPILGDHAVIVKKTVMALYVHLICHQSYTRAAHIKDTLVGMLTTLDIKAKLIVYSFTLITDYKQKKVRRYLKKFSSIFKC